MNSETKQKIKTKWTEERVLSVINEARKVGSVFAAKRLAELQAAGPKYAVCDGGEVVGRMFDVCGFANLRISARGKFFQVAKMICESSILHVNHVRSCLLRFYCTNRYHGGGWLSIYDSTNRQEMSVNVAACKGHQQVLAKYGIESTVESRID